MGPEYQQRNSRRRTADEQHHSDHFIRPFFLVPKHVYHQKPSEDDSDDMSLSDVMQERMRFGIDEIGETFVDPIEYDE